MKTRKLIIIGIILGITVSVFGTVWVIGNSNPAFPLGYTRIPQNDMHCSTEWWIEPTEINKDEIATSIHDTITSFGSHVDIPGRNVSFSQREDHTVVSVAGTWTEDNAQHRELTDTILEYIGSSKIIRNDVVMCA